MKKLALVGMVAILILGGWDARAYLTRGNSPEPAATSAAALASASVAPSISSPALAPSPAPPQTVDAASSPTSAPTSSAPAPAALWVQQYGVDADTIQVSVHSLGLTVRTMSRSDQATLTDFLALRSQLTQTMNTVGATAKHIESSGREGFDLYAAAWTMYEGLYSLSNYVANPSDHGSLKSFRDFFSRGVSQWNAAVSTLYRSAGQIPPTI